MTRSALQRRILQSLALILMSAVLLNARMPSFTKNRNNWYAQLFMLINSNLDDNNETQMVFNNFQSQFNREIVSIAEGGKPLKEDSVHKPNIKTTAKSKLQTKVLATEAYGDGSDLMSRDKKVIICGAKGKVVDEKSVKTLKILALSEVMHPSAGAIVAGYASVQENGFFDFDIKINDNYRNRSTGSNGEFVVSRIVSNKILLNEQKFAIGSSSIYILSLGLDFIKFTVYHLIVGIAIKSHAVYSQSIIDMQVYIASRKDGIESHEGAFASTNECSFSSACVTKHYGFLRVNHNRAKRIQNMLGKSMIANNSTDSLASASFKQS